MMQDIKSYETKLFKSLPLAMDSQSHETFAYLPNICIPPSCTRALVVVVVHFGFHGLPMAAEGPAAVHETISPDLVVQMFQLRWEEEGRARAAAASAAAAEANDAEAHDAEAHDRGMAGGGAAGRPGKKVLIKDEAVVASAEVLRMFAAEMVQRAAEVARQDGDGVVDGSHLERVLPQLLLDFA